MGVYGTLAAIMRIRWDLRSVATYNTEKNAHERRRRSDTTQNSITECNWSTIWQTFLLTCVCMYIYIKCCVHQMLKTMRLHVVSCLLRFPVRKCLGKCDLTELSACSTRHFNTLYVSLPYLNPKVQQEIIHVFLLSYNRNAENLDLYNRIFNSSWGFLWSGDIQAAWQQLWPMHKA